MPMLAGTRLGPYEVLTPLGQGGMGEVYRARDTRLDRTVAIKVIAARIARIRGARNRLIAEARAVSAAQPSEHLRAVRHRRRTSRPISS